MKTNKQTNRYESLSVDTIRVLGVEAIAEANSGHPGIVLGAAPTMYALFKDHLTVDVNNPKFINRDRFVLSAGHGSALLYATMHLAGYKSVTLQDIKNFRKINAKTAGHPENIMIDGIDCTTGPLGQGVSLAVGMAIAETKLNAYFKKNKLFNHYTYCLFGDGCFQEGIFHESISIAAKYKLNKLIFLYDSNDIQLDGKTTDSTEIDTKKYFESLGLNYIKVANGNSATDISEAIKRAKESKEKPTVIEIKTIIGYGSVNENSNKAHGSALNKDQVALLKEKLGYHNDTFEISGFVYRDFANLHKRGEKAALEFNKKISELKKDQKKYKVFTNIENHTNEFESSWFKNMSFEKGATRNIFGSAIQPIAEANELLSFLSADISSSTKVWATKGDLYSAENRLGQNINVGVREFAMNAIASGISIHSGLKAFTSTFLTFADYNKAAIRLAAISHSPLISVYSHDSISVGEDGPTHQPVEHLWSLRLIPNHVLIRPANLKEMLFALDFAINAVDHPTTIITSRLDFNQHLGDNKTSKPSRGGYILNGVKNYDTTLVGTGSEVATAVAVAKILDEKYQIKANVVSMPSVEIFTKQIKVYQEGVLGNKPTIAIEFGSTYPWYKITDYAVGINRFGHSGPHADVLKKMKLTDSEIADQIKSFLATQK